MAAVAFFNETETQWVLGTIILIEILSSIFSLYYITNHLKISAHFKRILKSEAIFSFVGSILKNIGFSLISFDHQNQISCALLIDIVPISIMANNFFAMALAIIRESLAKKVQTHQEFQDENIKTTYFTGNLSHFRNFASFFENMKI